ncbi:uncharacterized protein LOC135165791 [Diachasmimorpha longicaudata]|uniref:uncharacterized protein LOC135165791 n=1 Tax=Diachasmimorpha longicaudata TaxID=58733 RepID=UPI0030B8CC6E
MLTRAYQLADCEGTKGVRVSTNETTIVKDRILFYTSEVIDYNKVPVYTHEQMAHPQKCRFREDNETMDGGFTWTRGFYQLPDACTSCTQGAPIYTSSKPSRSTWLVQMRYGYWKGEIERAWNFTVVSIPTTV